jgi:hypothetical protein
MIDGDGGGGGSDGMVLIKMSSSNDQNNCIFFISLYKCMYVCVYIFFSSQKKTREIEERGEKKIMCVYTHIIHIPSIHF